MLDLIRIMLTPNPLYRPSIFELEKILNNYWDLKEISLNVNTCYFILYILSRNKQNK